MRSWLIVGLFLLNGGIAATPASARAATLSQGEETLEESKGQSAAAIAEVILDESKEGSVRETAIGEHPELAAELVAAMSRGLGTDPKEEYRRIPWIWRVAIAAGRRNEEGELLRLLAVALPEDQALLTDWQAVVVGGGLINGITQSGAWPGERIETLVRRDPRLSRRWQRALDLASKMADDKSVPTGTRYDALRMIGAQSWDLRGGQLFRYLTKGVHPELQQGAISALGDIQSLVVPQALLSGFAHYSEANRRLVIESLLRDDGRREALLDALASGHLTRGDLSPEIERRLVDPKQNHSFERARSLLAK